VRDIIREKHPASSDADIVSHATQEWMGMDRRSRAAFRDMFGNALVMQSAIEGIPFLHAF
jgi:hypothetical protein